MIKNKKLPKLAELDVNIVFDGASLVQGVNNCADRTKRWTEALAGIMKPYCKSLSYKNIAVSGQTAKNMLKGTFSDSCKELIRGKTNILFCMEGINSILNYDVNGDEFGSATGGENLNVFKAYCTKNQPTKEKAGYDYIILLTEYYPRLKKGKYNRVEWTEERLLEQEKFFNLTNQEFKEGVLGIDLVLDLRNHPTLGGERGQETDSKWSDSIHLFKNGHQELDRWIFDNTISKLFNLNPVD